MIQFVTGKSSHSGSVPEDSGSQYKSPVLGLKGGLWVCKKSQKMSTASDQYFLSYVKKTTGGGQIDPPPAGIGLKLEKNLINSAQSSHQIYINLFSYLPGDLSIYLHDVWRTKQRDWDILIIDYQDDYILIHQFIQPSLHPIPPSYKEISQVFRLPALLE